MTTSADEGVETTPTDPQRTLWIQKGVLNFIYNCEFNDIMAIEEDLNHIQLCSRAMVQWLEFLTRVLLRTGYRQWWIVVHE